ncbi:MAG: hypothetical protein PVI86_12920 [Phycisphaerae bacterium]|jgi:hypothetical protein
MTKRDTRVSVGGIEVGSEARPGEAEPSASVRSTRRSFLSRTGKRAVFVLPAVWTLSARHAAAGSGVSCSAAGAPCVVDDDCCSLNCNGASMTCEAL